MRGSQLLLKQPKAMRFTARVPARAQGTALPLRQTPQARQEQPFSFGRQQIAGGRSTQLDTARAARSRVTGRSQAGIGNAYRQGAEGQFHKGASRRRARRRAVTQWRSPPGRRHMALRTHARNYATRCMWSYEAVFGQEQCQDEGGQVVRAFSFGLACLASSRSVSVCLGSYKHRNGHLYAPRRTAP